MFTHQFEDELWNMWKKRPVSVLLTMQPVLLQIHKILSEEYKINETKLNLIINHFNDKLNKSQYSIDSTDDSYENIVNLVFNLAALNTITTINCFLKPLAGT